ncbi:MAG: hypothetical protein U9Q39_06425, partial [Pseudomonadota bacterium]|nr:hypothetical protein [Pseudomonadota bacterium]
MFIDFLSRFKVSSFIKFLISLNVVSILGLLVFPGSVSASVFSLVLHAFLAVALSWFMVKVVGPVWASFDQLVFFVEQHKANGREKANPSPKINMGNYRGILEGTIQLLEDQYEDLLSHSRQLENFSRVLENQNRKLNERRERYRRTLDALENGVYLVDDNYIIQSINRAEAAYFGA